MDASWVRERVFFKLTSNVHGVSPWSFAEVFVHLRIDMVLQASYSVLLKGAYEDEVRSMVDGETHIDTWGRSRFLLRDSYTISC